MEYINSLWMALQERLEAETSEKGTIDKLNRCIILIREALFELKGQVLEKPFSNTADEISFFKVQLPNFYSLFLYHKRMLQIEKLLPPGQENQVKFLEREYKRLAFYFEQNADWVLYYRSGANYLDEIHFQHQNEPWQIHTDCDIVFDQRFSRPGTYPFSKIKALELMQAYLDRRIVQVKDSSLHILEAVKPKTTLRWTGSKSDLIELLYALHSSKLFNNNEFLDVRQIANWMETTLHINLGNYYRVFQGIRIRKKSRTQFLDNLKENLIKRMDTTDENPRY